MLKKIFIKKNIQQKGLAILGSTGNIGVQTLSIASQFSHQFRIKLLTAGNNASLLISQAKEYQPEMVFIADEEQYHTVRLALRGENILVLKSQEQMLDSFKDNSIDLVFIAIVGFAGLLPAIKALEAKKDIALANKESLVVGGDLLLDKAKQNNVKIIPVDSEHSAIFQCLIGEEIDTVEKLILTASGGPFYNYTKEKLQSVKPKDALNHPIWKMGKKVSVDSASLMNKGLEAIEAKHLFNLSPNQIEVVIHPQSVIHSMVQFTDGSIKAQMGPPDMKSPIHFSLFYPNRVSSNLTRFNFMQLHDLSFRPVDIKKFRNLALAFEAMKKGGNMPAILNAANEAAVEAFLQEKISFLQISKIVEEMMETINHIEKPDYKDLVYTHQKTTEESNKLINRINF